MPADPTSAPAAVRLPTVPDGAYGSDDLTGLVWGFTFRSGERPRRVGLDEARGLAAAEGEGGVWLHFSLSNSKAEPWLRAHLTLPNEFFEMLREKPSTRVEAVDDALVAVIRDMPYFGTGEAGTDATVTLYVDERLMISARSQQVRSIERLRTAVAGGETFESPVGLLAHLLRDQADVLVDMVRETTRAVDEVEDRLLDSSSVSGRPALSRLRRGLVRVQRTLSPEPAALFRLLSRPPAWLTAADLGELRRSAEELAAAVTDSGAVTERIRILQDELSARLDESTSRTLFLLTVLTACLAPFEFIPALFGMSVRGIPFSDNPYGFWIVFLIVVAFIAGGAVLVRRLLRRE